MTCGRFAGLKAVPAVLFIGVSGFRAATAGSLEPVPESPGRLILFFLRLIGLSPGIGYGGE